MGKYMFSWCSKCAALRGCYFQHGDKSPVPMFLDPECSVGPLGNDNDEISLSEDELEIFNAIVAHPKAEGGEDE